MFENITIVSIDGRVGDCLGAQYAIRKSAQELPGANQLLITAAKPNCLLKGIKHQQIQPLSYFEYAVFVLYSLYQHIETEYALIVQEDGWVLNGDNWSDTFFEYDYVGAPIHFALVSHEGKSQYFRQFQWTQFLGKTGFDIQFVQNGGFSLRSRSFLEAFSEHKLPYTLPAPRTYKDNQGVGRFDWGHTDSQFEDVYCCIDKRVILENFGLKFAPLEVCKHFAFEHLGVGLHEQLQLDSIFGHHSKFRRMKTDGSFGVHYMINESVANSIYGEAEIVRLLKRQGTAVDFQL